MGRRTDSRKRHYAAVSAYNQNETRINMNSISRILYACMGLLTVTFIALKVSGEIAWPWIWVLSPIWLPVVAGLSFLVVGAIVLSLILLHSEWRLKRLRRQREWLIKERERLEQAYKDIAAGT